VKLQFAKFAFGKSSFPRIEVMSDANLALNLQKMVLRLETHHQHHIMLLGKWHRCINLALLFQPLMQPVESCASVKCDSTISGSCYFITSMRRKIHQTLG
jgi:hypothetical protein